MLESAGLTLKDVTLININFALTTALMSGQVDGVIGAFRNFELNELELAKARAALWPVEQHGVPTYDELITDRQARDIGSDRRRDRLLSALGEATAWLKANPAEAWSVFSGYAKELDSELNKARLERHRCPCSPTIRWRWTRNATTPSRRSLFSSGLIKQAPPPDAYLRDLRP